MYDIQSLKTKLESLGVQPNKKLGQNFLINTEISERIFQRTQRLEPSHIVEVGPGIGALTEFTIQSKIPTTLIELDRTFAKYWQEKQQNVICEDALNLNWADLKLPNKTVLMSNLPYQISSTLLIDRSLEYCGIDAMVLMFQKEVGQRIMATKNTKEYGFLTVIAQTFWTVDKLFDVGPKDFYPSPQVASRVLVFKRRDPQIEDPELFLKFVKQCFQFRRKLMIRNISSKEDFAQNEKKIVAMGFSAKVRAEDISPEEYVMLHKGLKS